MRKLTAWCGIALTLLALMGGTMPTSASSRCLGGATCDPNCAMHRRVASNPAPRSCCAPKQAVPKKSATASKCRCIKSAEPGRDALMAPAVTVPILDFIALSPALPQTAETALFDAQPIEFHNHGPPGGEPIRGFHSRGPPAMAASI